MATIVLFRSDRRNTFAARSHNPSRAEEGTLAGETERRGRHGGRRGTPGGRDYGRGRRHSRCRDGCRDRIDVLFERARAGALGVALAQELPHRVKEVPARVHEIELALKLRQLRLHARLAARFLDLRLDGGALLLQRLLGRPKRLGR